MIFRSPEPPLALPETALTPFLLERATSRRDKPAFIDVTSGRTLTLHGWAAAVRKTAAGLAARGLRKGDVLALYSPNRPEYAVAFHAASLLGGILTAANPQLTEGELSRQLKDAGARYLVTVPELLPKARQAAAGLGVRDIIVFDEAEGATPFHTLALAEGEPPDTPIDPRKDLVALPYSGGTTGLPKGVMLTHYNMVANILQTATAMWVSERDTLLGVLPFFHIYGLQVLINIALYAGATVVTLPRFEIETCLAAIQRYKITRAHVVPPIVQALARDPRVDQYALDSLHVVFSGAAPLPEDVAALASARLGCPVVQGYGLTETSPVTHATRPDGVRTKRGSIGRPIPNTEARVVDVATGAELGPNEAGEICIRGPQVMKGYWNRPQATAAMIDPAGWLRTGDLGYADDDGYFFVVDRVKDLIKHQGLQIAPAELEAVLLSHPAVAEVCVIPLADPDTGQVPKAFVVLKGEATPQQLMDFVALRVAPYKKLRSVEAVDAIPKSPAGKTLRRLLIERDRASE